MPGPQALGIRGSWHRVSSNLHLKPAVSLRKIKGSSSSSSFFASGTRSSGLPLPVALAFFSPFGGILPWWCERRNTSCHFRLPALQRRLARLFAARCRLCHAGLRDLLCPFVSKTEQTNSCHQQEINYSPRGGAAHIPQHNGPKGSVIHKQ